MSITTKKLELIDRLMKVGETKTLERVEELLLQVEMQGRADESMNAIREGNVISLEQFAQDTKQWLKARRALK